MFKPYNHEPSMGTAWLSMRWRPVGAGEDGGDYAWGYTGSLMGWCGEGKDSLIHLAQEGASWVKGYTS